MNDFYPEQLVEIAKQRIQREILTSQAARKTRQVSTVKRLLGTLGTWMVAGGEKLQALNTEALQSNQLRFSQDNSKKAKA